MPQKKYTMAVKNVLGRDYMKHYDGEPFRFKKDETLEVPIQAGKFLVSNSMVTIHQDGMSGLRPALKEVKEEPKKPAGNKK